MKQKGNFKMLKVHTADTLISQTNLNAFLLFVLIPIDKCHQGIFSLRQRPLQKLTTNQNAVL